MPKISVVINTRNEEDNIARAIGSVKKFSHEIVVCDMYSDDDTVKIAKKLGAVIVYHKKTNYVEPARNFAIKKATGDWILILDADEEIPPSLAKMLIEVADKPKADYFRIARKNLIFDKWIEHSNWWPDYNIRFFKKGSVVWGNIIHSIPTTIGKGSDFEPDQEFAIIHHNYRSVEQYISRLNRYTTIQSNNLVKSGYKLMWVDIVAKPNAEFLRRYFAHEGYKDGIHGLALALLQSFSELVVYLKVWQHEKFTDHAPSIFEIDKVISDAQSEMNYWKSDAVFKKNGSLRSKIKRRLKLQ
jgi:(heptosyl)LPS beta-1,4-glucosyltransferase